MTMLVGQMGYEEYGKAGEWKTFDGRPMPTWDELGKSDTGRETRRRWNLAGDAMVCVEDTGLDTMVSRLLEHHSLDRILLELAREVQGRGNSDVPSSQVASVVDAAVLRRAIGKLSGVW